jgi:serine protease
MNRFSFFKSSTRIHRWLLGGCLCSLVSASTWASPPPPISGVLVQLKTPATTETPLPVLVRETAQAKREQAQALWESRHQRERARLHTIADAVGVVHNGISTAGSWLKLNVDSQDPQALDAIMRRLRLHPDVQAVIPNVRLQRQQSTNSPTPFLPNDPQFAQQWFLQIPSTTVASGINMPTAWGRWGNLNKSSPPTIAVVDTGVRFDHPDLAGRLLPGYDFVSELEYANDGDGRDSDASDPGDWVTRADTVNGAFRGCDVGNSTWHGTAIAGLIAANHSNGLGVSGVHPEARILPVRIAGKCGASLSDLLDGVRWAAGLPVAGVPSNPYPARIINLSYGGSSACDSAYQSTINDVRAAGALVIVAAGNGGGAPTRPADCQGVVAVTAVRGDGAKADYASFGSAIALAAPGGSGYLGADHGLLTTLDSGLQHPIGATYGNLTGTSFAAPLAAGVAGMMLSIRPDLNVSDLDALLRQSVRPHTTSVLLSNCQSGFFSQGVCNCTTSTCGSGLLDADMALKVVSAFPAAGTTTPSPSTNTNTSNSNTSGGGGYSSVWWGSLLWIWLLGFALNRYKTAKTLPLSLPLA